MTIRFYDVSHYQGAFHPAGPTIAKATEGTGFVDEQYTATRSRTLQGGWPFAGYHFLRSGSIPAQAAHAHDVIGKTPAMVDVETAVDGSWPTWAEFKAFVTAYRGLGGVVHLAYIPKWFHSAKWKSVSMKWLTDNGIALISSNYSEPYSDGGIGWQPYGGVTPLIWQFTSTPVDTNAFQGTQDELGALFETGSIDMALTADDVHTIVTAKSLPADTPTMSLGTAILSAKDKATSADAKADALAAKVDALAAKVDALPTTTAPAGPLSDADKDDIAKRVLDGFAERQQS